MTKSKVNKTINLDLQNIDQHIWHPYAKARLKDNILITNADGIYIFNHENKLIDSISSWWSVSYGHKNTKIISSIRQQLDKLPHVMFAGLTHEPALNLTFELKNLLDDHFEQFFYSDSGSIAVEVALKLSLQYQTAKSRTQRTKFIALQNGYHGDTFNAMMVSDPDNSMHQLFNQNNSNYFLPTPPPLTEKVFDFECGKFYKSLSKEEYEQSTFAKELKLVLNNHKEEVAAFICEPMVQGAGGFNFYDLRYLDYAIKELREHDILIIFDEIATGFGRCGSDFAFQTINQQPDILTLGKALTGGHVTLGATAINSNVASTLSNNPPNAFMHGPTFMANPLACSAGAVAVKIFKEEYSIKGMEYNLEINYPIKVQSKISKIFHSRYSKFIKELTPLLQSSDYLKDLRQIGPILVCEFQSPLNKAKTQEYFLEKGIWIRPFGNILYIMPPYIISDQELCQLLSCLTDFIRLVNIDDQYKSLAVNYV